ncbi:hypothetical protein DDZ13_05635 [Coraliomargarita sinensis]|uniref:Uncharacterized protein n=1 Tax=Coraliomargarita sinensis TaxID=2174842 RepID=A0A317ZG85_9BACT|nr:hypothetical protein [Coraliomargarita sinensis]PXA04654.1 hypothetical protein DDZ13_05635 [Coraliomargarita sinensis]
MKIIWNAHTMMQVRLTAKACRYQNFNRRVCFYLLTAYLLAVSLHAEPRTWKSTSGSTIKAVFLGSFGEDYWFEANEDGRFIKMPSKYISAADIKLVESGEVKGVFSDTICDEAEASIRLLEQLYTRPAEQLPADVETIGEAIELLILPLQPEGDEAEPIDVDYTKRRYKKAGIVEMPESGTILHVLKQLLATHDLSFRIEEGELIIGKL